MADQPVVVGVDGSANSQQALRWAAEYATMSGAPLHAVIAWDVPATYGMPTYYDDVDFAAQAQATLHSAVQDTLGESIAITERVARGHAGPVLVAESDQARLLVVGSHGHGNIAAALLGSVSQYCVHHANCPVVIVRQPTSK